MKINENRLPLLINDHNQKYLLKIVQNELKLISSKHEINIDTDVEEFIATIENQKIEISILKEGRVWNTFLNKTGDQSDFVPMFQKKYQNLHLGAIITNNRMYSENIYLFGYSNLSTHVKLLYWEKKDRWIGPMVLDQGEDLILTNSCCRNDINGNLNIVYIIKNGQQNQLLHRKLTENGKWTNSVVIAQNKFNESLSEPLLLLHQNKLYSFWVGEQENHKTIYYSTNQDLDRTNWETPEILTKINGDMSLVYLLAGTTQKFPWIVLKTNLQRKGYIQNREKWHPIEVPENLKEIRIASNVDLKWGQRALSYIDSTNLWIPELNVKTSSNLSEQPIPGQSNHSNQENLPPSSTPKSPREIIKQSLRNKGYKYGKDKITSYNTYNQKSTSSRHENFNNINSQQYDKSKKAFSDLSELTNKIKELQKKIDDLDKNIDKINEKFQRLSTYLQCHNEEQDNNNKEKSEKNKNLFSKLFR